MSNLLLICMGLAMFAVLLSLAAGLVSMVKGGEFNKKYGNKLMQARIMSQGLALFFLVMAFFASQS